MSDRKIIQAQVFPSESSAVARYELHVIFDKTEDPSLFTAVTPVSSLDDLHAKLEAYGLWAENKFDDRVVVSPQTLTDLNL